MEFIFHSETAKLSAGRIGGKARNLQRLETMGIAVPEWGVIPADTFEEILHPVMGRRDEEVKRSLENFNIPASFIQSITARFGTAHYFAVRSSATVEDGTEFSFAGQFSSLMFIRPEGLAEAIKTVWASAFYERLNVYRQQHKISEVPRLAVIVQRMLDAEISGVAFGIDPVSGSRSTQVISAVYGLGEGIVSGELTADVYRLKKDVISPEIAMKTHRLVKGTGEGLVKAAVEEPLQRLPALSEAQVKEIGTLLSRLQKHFIKPQDIEFAVEKNKIWLLQSRPITRLEKLADPEGDYIVWDNSNIIESYPGLTSPLTFSFIIDVYESVYRQFCNLMGVSTRDIAANENVFAHMLGLLNGRVYYNLLSWYKVLALLPGYSLNAGFMEKMMGVKERFTLTGLPSRSKLTERLRVLNMLAVMIKNFLTLPAQRKHFQAHLDQVIAEYEKKDLDSLRPEELFRLYKELETTVLKKWKAPLVNDFYAMIYFGLLQKFTSSAGSTIHNDLLCGARNIISTEPVKLLRQIIEEIQKSEAAKSLFRSPDEGLIWQKLSDGEQPEIKRLIDSFLKKFGERCVGELKLETITYRQKPERLMSIIRSFLAHPERAKAPMFHEESTRLKAEAEARKLTQGKPLKKILFNHILKNARDLVSQRENLRYERTRAFGLVRCLFTAIGKNFYAHNILEDERDIFYLKKEEIFDYIQGSSVSQDLKKLIALRKEEYAGWEKTTLAERIPTRGVVYHGNDFINKPAVSVSDDSLTPADNILKGIGCCPGIVRAKVRVLQNPEEIQSLNGDILVTSSTDPGWVILFPSASAILVERGSLLSHSAIVSREMGIPCIVGISGLLQHLKTGDWVEMNGSTGQIKMIHEPEPTR